MAHIVSIDHIGSNEDDLRLLVITGPIALLPSPLAGCIQVSQVCVVITPARNEFLRLADLQNKPLKP